MVLSTRSGSDPNVPRPWPPRKERRRAVAWTSEETALLQRAMRVKKPSLNWHQVAEIVATRDSEACRRQWTRVSRVALSGRSTKTRRKRPEEDPGPPRKAPRSMPNDTFGQFPVEDFDEFAPEWMAGPAASVVEMTQMGVVQVDDLMQPFSLDDIGAVLEGEDPGSLLSIETLDPPTAAERPAPAFVVTFRTVVGSAEKAAPAQGPILKTAMRANLFDRQDWRPVSYSYADLWGGAPPRVRSSSAPAPAPAPAPALRTSKITDFWRRRRMCRSLPRAPQLPKGSDTRSTGSACSWETAVAPPAWRPPALYSTTPTTTSAATAPP